MSGIIGKKIGMTSIFDQNGKNVPCTIIQAGPCFVTQVKSDKTDGYNAIQMSYEDKSEKNISAALLGHYKKSGVSPKAKIVEFKGMDDKKAGDVIHVDIFEEGDFINVTGTTKGKGFQGVVKRHGFAGVGGQTHGQHNRLRAPGSVGASSWPSRVFPGMRMAGRMGGNSVQIENLLVLKVLTDKNILVVSGCVPGAKGSYVIIEK